MPCKFGYVELMNERPNCADCIHTVCGDGGRHFGIRKVSGLGDQNYGMVVAYCRVQEDFVPAEARCDKLETEKRLTDGDVEGSCISKDDDGK